VVYFLRTSLGSDSQGRSIFMKAVYSTKIAFQIGVIVAMVSVLFGTLLGAAAAFFGKWVDYVVMWLVSTLSSIPYIVLLAVVVFMFSGSAFAAPSAVPSSLQNPIRGSAYSAPQVEQRRTGARARTALTGAP